MLLNPTKTANLILLLVIAIFQAPALADDSHLDEVTADKEIQRWIEQLGDPSFTVRQNANRKLIEAGISALPQLRRAANHPDRELGYRVERLIDFMDRVSLRQQVDAFLASDDPASFGMPGWPEYAELMKDVPAARLLFADMLRNEISLLKKFGPGGNTDHKSLIEERLQEIQEETNGNSDEVDVGSFAAVCFCIQRRGIKLDYNHQMLLFNVTLLRQVKSAVQSGERKDALVLLINLTMIENQDFSDLLAIGCGSELKLESVVPRAKMIFEKKNNPTSLRQQALLTIGRTGKRSDVDFLEKHFDDDAVSSIMRDGEFKTTLGDIAFAAAILLSKQELADYGLDREKPIFFADAEERAAAHAKFAKYRATEKAKSESDEAGENQPRGE